MSLAGCLFGWSIDSASRGKVEAGAAVGAGVAGAVCYGWMRRMLKVCSSRKGVLLLKNQLRPFETCHLPGDRYFFVKTTGDEVLSALGAAQLSSLAIYHLQVVALKLMNAVDKWQVFIGPMSIALAALWFIALPGQSPWAMWTRSPSVGAFGAELLTSWGFWVLFGIVMVLYFARVFVAHLWASSSFVVGLLLRSFGGFPVSLTPFLEVSVEPLPVGTWMLHHVSWAASREVFHHSTAHDSKESMDALIDWMEKEIGRSSYGRA